MSKILWYVIVLIKWKVYCKSTINIISEQTRRLLIVFPSAKSTAWNTYYITNSNYTTLAFRFRKTIAIDYLSNQFAGRNISGYVLPYSDQQVRNFEIFSLGYIENQAYCQNVLHEEKLLRLVMTLFQTMVLYYHLNWIQLNEWFIYV